MHKRINFLGKHLKCQYTKLLLSLPVCVEADELFLLFCKCLVIWNSSSIYRKILYYLDLDRIISTMSTLTRQQSCILRKLSIGWRGQLPLKPFLYGLYLIPAKSSFYGISHSNLSKATKTVSATDPTTVIGPPIIGRYNKSLIILLYITCKRAQILIALIGNFGFFGFFFYFIIVLFIIIGITTKTASVAQKHLESVVLLRPVLGICHDMSTHRMEFKEVTQSNSKDGD